MDAPGLPLAPVSRSDAVQSAHAGITRQAFMYRLKHRAAHTGIAECAPHDLLRTLVSGATPMDEPFTGRTALMKGLFEGIEG